MPATRPSLQPRRAEHMPIWRGLGWARPGAANPDGSVRAGARPAGGRSPAIVHKLICSQLHRGSLFFRRCGRANPSHRTHTDLKPFEDAHLSWRVLPRTRGIRGAESVANEYLSC